jgi:hypothetical protein
VPPDKESLLTIKLPIWPASIVVSPVFALTLNVISGLLIGRMVPVN